VILPPGYEVLEFENVIGFAWGAAGPWMGDVLSHGQTLHGWAAEQEGAKPLVGRGPLHAIPAPARGPDERQRWAVRRYYRGGLVAPLLRDRYWPSGPPRPLRELWATVEARARGVPAPAVVAGAVYGAKPFYRADLVTELIPDARTLEARIFGSGGAPDASPLLRHAGRLVRTLEKALVLHVDLNAANILLIRGEEESGARVVDLDGCVVFPLGSRDFGNAMRRRLERSLRKLARRHGRTVRDEEWQALRSGYEDAIG
jgi:3-deoxy-D-manno-octulosonic acid kinase